MSKVVVHIAAGGIAQFELHPGQRLRGQLIQFLDHEVSRCLIDHPERLALLTRFDEDALGTAVQDYAVRHGNFLCGNRGSRLQVGNHDPAIFVGGKLTVAAADHSAGLVRNEERCPLQRLLAALGFQILLDSEGDLGNILHDYIVSAAAGSSRRGISSVGSSTAGRAGDRAAVAAVADRDDMGRGVKDIIGGHPGFHHDHRRIGSKARHGHGPIDPGGVTANEVPVAVFQNKLRIGHGLSSNRVLFRERQ